MITQYREDALRRALENLHASVPGVRSSVIVNTDGLLVTAYPPAQDARSPSSESVAAMSAVLMSLAERTLSRLEQGELGRVLIEGQHGIVVVFPATADAALAVLVDKAAKIGVTLHAIRQCAEEIRHILR